MDSRPKLRRSDGRPYSKKEAEVRGLGAPATPRQRIEWLRAS
jgi:hypothetical protein